MSMLWELDALKILAKNQTVPGIALRDTIKEIERLQEKLLRSAAMVDVLQTELTNALDALKILMTYQPEAGAQDGHTERMSDGYLAALFNARKVLGGDAREEANG